MGRKISDEKKRHVERLRAKGIPQKEIAAIVGVSVGAVNKFVANPIKTSGTEGSVSSESSTTTKPVGGPEEAGDIPDVIPDGVDVSTVDRWIPRIEKAAEAAEAAKDFGAMASLLAKLTALLEHKRKATPMPKADPNENPDMIAAKERARKEFHRLIDHSLITRVTIA